MTVFSVWAPDAERVDVEVSGQAQPMSPVADRPGWWAAEAAAPAGTDYAFRLDGGEPLADPRSPRQPYGPDGASQTYDHGAFAWTDGLWRGASLPGAVIYELHVGTFTPEGTLDAAIGRLDHLISLGVTVVELMPVAAFPGSHGWGYDGIGLWAVHEPYGGPDALKRFVSACHSCGLGVFLDVVYNHVGPGNKLASFGPYFTDVYSTPWGPAVNLDQAWSDEVRSFIVDNALMWLRDYHADGLRLDAVHAFADRRAVHLLEELAVAVDALAAAAGRSLVLVAESDMNNPRLITPRSAGGYGLTGQWNDDFHHAVHALVTGERQGYYGDFGAIAGVAKVLVGAYFYDGTWSSFRRRTHGRRVDAGSTPAYRFVVFAQDHDQVGNRAAGDRLPATLAGHPRRDGLLRIAAGLVLTAPFTPMLFMGEEWGADTPWQFFTDHTDPLFASAASNGRRSEFARHGWEFAAVPDPQDSETFLRSKLDWSQPGRQPHKSLLSWYRALIALRRSRPELTDPRLDRVRVSFSEEERWLVVHRGALRIVANLAEGLVEVPVGGSAAGVGSATEILLASDPDISVKSDRIVVPPASFSIVEAPLPEKDAPGHFQRGSRRGTSLRNDLGHSRRGGRGMSQVHHSDVIGSLLRPKYLTIARDAYAAGRLTTPEFKRIEDSAVDTAIAMQEGIGLDVVTDGEFRRFSFLDQVVSEVNGVEPIEGAPVHFKNATEDWIWHNPFTVTGKISQKRKITLEEFAYNRARATKRVKITFPSPMLFYSAWSPELSTAAYKDAYELFADAAAIIKAECEELAALGCDYIQIDSPDIGSIVDPENRELRENLGMPTERTLTEGLDIFNSVGDIPGVTFAVHVCKGNNMSQWISSGGYELTAQAMFHRLTNFAIFLLEYDDERSGSFEPLAMAPDDKQIILGLVSSKTTTLESVSDITARIHEAAKYTGLERLGVSTQCGFSSTLPGANLTTQDVQEQKLQLVAEVAHSVW